MTNALDLERLPACSLCNEPRFTPITAKGTHFHGEMAVLCHGCGVVYLNPRMSTSALQQYYASDSFSKDFRGSAQPSADAQRYRDERALRRWNFVKKALPPKSRVLEIGCSSGSFVEILNRNGHSAAGIDASTGFSAYGRMRDLEIYTGMFPQDLPESLGSFDAIGIFQVIEHMERPWEILRDIYARLKPGGLLLLEYPDLGVALNRTRFQASYFQKSHLYDYTRDVMERLLRREGFRVVQAYYEQEVPLDKNVMLVAEKKTPETVELRSPQSSRKLYCHLDRKLRLSLWRKVHARIAPRKRAKTALKILCALKPRALAKRIKTKYGTNNS